MAESGEKRRVILMCDYFADPVWWTPDRGASLDDIPLSGATRQALRHWAESYDLLEQHDYEWPSEAAKAEFGRRGRALWADVQEELGVDWEVGYFDEELSAVVWSRGE